MGRRLRACAAVCVIGAMLFAVAPASRVLASPMRAEAARSASQTPRASRLGATAAAAEQQTSGSAQAPPSCDNAPGAVAAGQCTVPPAAFGLQCGQTGCSDGSPFSQASPVVHQTTTSCFDFTPQSAPPGAVPQFYEDAALPNCTGTAYAGAYANPSIGLIDVGTLTDLVSNERVSEGLFAQPSFPDPFCTPSTGTTGTPSVTGIGTGTTGTPSVTGEELCPPVQLDLTVTGEEAAFVVSNGWGALANAGLAIAAGGLVGPSSSSGQVCSTSAAVTIGVPELAGSELGSDLLDVEGQLENYVQAAIDLAQHHSLVGLVNALATALGGGACSMPFKQTVSEELFPSLVNGSWVLEPTVPFIPYLELTTGNAGLGVMGSIIEGAVSLQVTGTMAPVESPTSVALTWEAPTGTPLSPSQMSSSQIGEPVSLEAQVLDEKGQPLESHQAVTFGFSWVSEDPATGEPLAEHATCTKAATSSYEPVACDLRFFSGSTGSFTLPSGLTAVSASFPGMYSASRQTDFAPSSSLSAPLTVAPEPVTVSLAGLAEGETVYAGQTVTLTATVARASTQSLGPAPEGGWFLFEQNGFDLGACQPTAWPYDQCSVTWTPSSLPAGEASQEDRFSVAWEPPSEELTTASSGPVNVVVQNTSGLAVLSTGLPASLGWQFHCTRWGYVKGARACIGGTWANEGSSVTVGVGLFYDGAPEVGMPATVSVPALGFDQTCSTDQSGWCSVTVTVPDQAGSYQVHVSGVDELGQRATTTSTITYTVPPGPTGVNPSVSLTSSPSAVGVGTAVKLTATLDPGVTDKTVTFTSTSGAIGACTPALEVPGGSSSCSISWVPKSPGTDTVQASWPGDQYFGGASAAAHVTVGSVSVSGFADPDPIGLSCRPVAGKTVCSRTGSTSLEAFVTTGGAPLAGRAVSFRWSSGSLGTCTTDSAGLCAVPFSVPSPPPVTTTYQIVATDEASGSSALVLVTYQVHPSSFATTSTSGIDPSVRLEGASAQVGGWGTLTLSLESDSPEPPPPVAVSGDYMDLNVAPGAGTGLPGTVTLDDCMARTGSLYFWTGPGWKLVEPQQRVNGCLVASLGSTSSPNVSDLGGTLFAAGSGAPSPSSPTPSSSSRCSPATPPPGPVVSIAPDASSGGYWMATAFGHVISCHGTFMGSPASLAAPVVAIVPTRHGNGYWLVGSDGGVFTYGTARFYGSLPGLPAPVRPHSPVVALVPDPTGGGYWEVTMAGDVYSFGNAAFHGSLGAVPLAEPIVGAAVDPATGGYWLVGAEGNVFSFDAPFYGSMGGLHLDKPVVGIAAAPTGHGYWLVAADGGVFSFGSARFYGSTGGAAPGRAEHSLHLHHARLSAGGLSFDR